MPYTYKEKYKETTGYDVGSYTINNGEYYDEHFVLFLCYEIDKLNLKLKQTKKQ